jgi:F-type H+-transporting ATPase subunit b
MGIGLDLATFVGQLVSFLILLGLLIYFGYKPVRKMLDERSNRIQESIERAEATEKEYERAQLEVDRRIDKARQEARRIIAEAGQLGDRLKEEARRQAGQEARQEAKDIVARTRAELEEERGKVIDDLRREFADMVILASEKVINETLDKKKHRKIIEEALKQSATFRKN